MRKFLAMGRPLLSSLLLHGLLLAALIGVFSFVPKRPLSVASKSVPTIAVNTVDARQVAAQVKSIVAARNQQEVSRKQRVRALERKLNQLQANKKTESIKLKRLSRLKRKAKQDLQKKNKLLSSENKKIKAARRAALKEQDNLTVLKKKRSALLKKKQQQLADALQKQVMQLEKQRLAAQQATVISAKVNQYVAQIQVAIQQVWSVPADVNQHLSCQFLIRLAENGAVLSVMLLKSSGNAILDRSAKIAVMKASPLPVPHDAVYFSKFKTLRLTLTPSHILG